MEQVLSDFRPGGEILSQIRKSVAEILQTTTDQFFLHALQPVFDYFDTVDGKLTPEGMLYELQETEFFRDMPTDKLLEICETYEQNDQRMTINLIKMYLRPRWGFNDLDALLQKGWPLFLLADANIEELIDNLTWEDDYRGGVKFYFYNQVIWQFNVGDWAEKYFPFYDVIALTAKHENDVDGVVTGPDITVGAKTETKKPSTLELGKWETVETTREITVGKPDEEELPESFQALAEVPVAGLSFYANRHQGFSYKLDPLGVHYDEIQFVPDDADFMRRLQKQKLKPQDRFLNVELDLGIRNPLTQKLITQSEDADLILAHFLNYAYKNKAWVPLKTSKRPALFLEETDAYFELPDYNLRIVRHSALFHNQQKNVKWHRTYKVMLGDFCVIEASDVVDANTYLKKRTAEATL